MPSESASFPEDLKACIDFHGHLCPGLVYGYRVAKEACRVLRLTRAADEEILAISENDSCAVDALQVILGTTLGKGSLIVRDYGKNAFTIADRKSRRAVRFSRKTNYRYGGDHPSEFNQLEAKLEADRITEAEKKRQRFLKSLDLLNRDFQSVFDSEEAPFPDVGYAALNRSVPCSHCGEMTMESKLVKRGTTFCCVACAEKIADKGV